MPNNFNYNEWLIIGVENGWIHVDRQTWNEYLKIKEEANKENNNNAE